jgi:flagellar assembly protein FliH
LSIDAAFAPLNFPAVGRRTDDDASVRGHAAGYAAGRKKAEQELDELRTALALDAQSRSESAAADLRLAVAALERSAELLRAHEVPALESVDAAIAAAAFELAEAIVGYELSAAPGSARAALARATDAVPVAVTRIRLNPEDSALIALHELGAGVVVVDDPSVERGGAILDIEHGSIDARVSTALARAKAALAGGPQ